MSLAQPDLFAPAPAALPEGLRYRPDLITAGEERRLIADIAAVPFKPFEFHGHLGKRRVAASARKGSRKSGIGCERLTSRLS